MGTRGVNKVIILGNLGQDPEVRFLPNGGAVANFTLATSESWKDKQTGEQKEKTEWHSVSLFGKLAEVAGEYLKKGSKVYIEGQLQTRKWQDQQGQEKYKTEVVVQGFNGVMQMLDSKPQGSQPAPQQGGYQQQAPQQRPPQQQGGFQQNQPGYGPGQPQQQFNQPQQQAPQQGGFNQQTPKVNPQVPTINFDDDIPY